MIHIKVYNNNVEKALSKLKKQVKETKLMLELRDREFYTKPSDLRKAKFEQSDISNLKLNNVLVNNMIFESTNDIPSNIKFQIL